jgi:bile acid-coenzyme A ligase
MASAVVDRNTHRSGIPYGAMLGVLAAAQPDAIALVCDSANGSTVLTRAQLDAWANRLARAYADCSLSQGDIATILLPNSPAFFAACLAIWKLGAVPNPLSHRLPSPERAAILARANPALVIGAQADAGDGRNCVPADLHVDAYPPDPLPERISPHERAMASGGSTGQPKLIVASNPAVYDPQTATPLFKGRNAVLVPGPLYHGAPFSAAFGGLFSGCAVVVMERFDALRCLELIERHRVDRMTVVPTMMQRIWRLPPGQREQFDVSSLEFVLTGSAPCPAWLMRAWIEWLGPEVMHEAFGPSERTGGTFISGTEWLAHPGSVGKPSAGVRLKILDDNGRELPPGEMGEIYVLPATGPGSTYHYVGATPRMTDDGWESFGDMGYLDADGYLYLGDRRSDMVLCGGRNIYPAEVEAAIDSLAGVRSSAVIGLPDEDLGQRLHAIVDVGPEGEAVDEAHLRAHLRERLLHYKIPTSMEFVTTLLRDDAGKMRRSSLRAARVPQGYTEAARNPAGTGRDTHGSGGTGEAPA